MNKKHRKAKQQNAARKANAGHPNIAVAATTEAKENGSKGTEQGEKAADLHPISRWRRFTNWLCTATVAEVGMFLLTLVIAGSGIYYTTYAKRQWRAMIATVNTTRQVSEREERAWLKITKIGSPKVAPNKPLQWELQIQNIGKTPARKIHAEFMIEIVPDGSYPDLDYGHRGRTVSELDKGILYPQDFLTHPIQVVRRFDTSDRGIKLLQPSEYQSLMQNKSYIVTHGRVNYCDTFGVLHWVKFCSFTSDKTNVRFVGNCGTVGNDADYADEP